MEIKIDGVGKNNKTIALPKPIWFEHLINSNGTNITFKFTFVSPIPQNLVKVKVKFNEKPYEVFLIDKIQTTTVNHIKLFVLSLSHPINYICQNNVQPQDFTAMSVQTFFEKFCKPFNIKSIKKHLLNAKPIAFSTSIDMSYWDVISLYFKQTFNLSVYLDENKNIDTKYRLPSNKQTLNLNDKNLIYINESENRTKLLSTVILQTEIDQPNQFSVIKQQNKILTDKGVNRTKFFKTPKQYANLPNKGAQAIFDRYNSLYKKVEIKFAKCLDVLYPGSIVSVNLNNQTVDLCVNSFYTAITKKGPVTTIEFLFSDLIV